jgi:hypothetical protein
MHPLVGAFEKHGLLDAAEVQQRLAAMPYPAASKICQDLHAALEEAKGLWREETDHSSLESLNLLASSSIRGETCEHCGPAKLQALARYAALYTDRVIVPYEFRIPQRDSLENRIWLSQRAANLVALRPVVEADVLRPVLPEFHYCQECGKKAKGVLLNVQKAVQDLTKRSYRDFEFIYRTISNRSILEIRGPTDYFEHGTGVILFHKKPSWAPSRMGSVDGTPGKVLSPTVVGRHALLKKHVMQRFGRDLIFQQLYGYRYGTKYLTDLPGEARFFSASSSDDALKRKTATLCSRLQHSVPFLDELPLAAILRIRREDPDSFTLYRQALGKILRDYVGGRGEVSDGDAEEVFREVLEPELIRLRRTVLAQRRSRLGKIMTKTLIPAVAVGLGVFSGLLPSEIAQLAKIIGATTLLSQAAEALLERTRPEQVQNSNLYFLVRLAEEHVAEGG